MRRPRARCPSADSAGPRLAGCGGGGDGGSAAEETTATVTTRRHGRPRPTAHDRYRATVPESERRVRAETTRSASPSPARRVGTHTLQPRPVTSRPVSAEWARRGSRRSSQRRNRTLEPHRRGLRDRRDRSAGFGVMDAEPYEDVARGGCNPDRGQLRVSDAARHAPAGVRLVRRSSRASTTSRSRSVTQTASIEWRRTVLGSPTQHRRVGAPSVDDDARRKRRGALRDGRHAAGRRPPLDSCIWRSASIAPRSRRRSSGSRSSRPVRGRRRTDPRTSLYFNDPDGVPTRAGDVRGLTARTGRAVGLTRGRPGRVLPSRREGPRHRPRDGCVRVRHRPRKRRPHQAARRRLLADVRRERPELRLKTIFDGVRRSSRSTRRTPSRSRSPSSAPTPASRSPSGRRAAPRSSRPRPPASSAPSTRPRASSRPSAATAAPTRRRCSGWCRRSSRLDAEPPDAHEADALAVAICHALAPPLREGGVVIARLRGAPGRPDGRRPRARRRRRRLPRRRDAVGAAGSAERRRRGHASRRTCTCARTRSSSTASPTPTSASSSRSCST